MVDKITTYRKQNKIKMRKMKHKECCGFTVSTTSNPYPQMHLSSSTSTLLLLLLLLSCFSRVQLCATPQTAVHQAPPSLGFSSQERWSGLPFPSPMHEVKSESEVVQSCLTLLDPMDCSLPGSSVHGIFQARVLEWSAIAFSKYIAK